MDSGLLLLLLCLVYSGAQFHLLRVDMVFAVAYFYLFVYGFFAITGYLYFPDLSQLISAYFGQDIEEPVLVFMILSFIAVYVGLVIAAPLRGSQSRFLIAARMQFNHVASATGLVLAFLCVEAAGLVAFWSDLSYSNAGDIQFIEDAGPLYAGWFSAFKVSPALIAVLYAVLRYKLWPGLAERVLLGALLAATLALFLLISFRVGNRTDLVALLNAFIFIELIRARSHGAGAWRTLGIACGLALLTIGVTVGIASGRGTYAGLNLTWLQALIFQDYFAPAHMLFAAVAYDVVDPVEVITSNSLNALVMMNYPYLQEFVAGFFNPGASNRVASYAFYALSEGYLVLGPVGFLYNGLIFAGGLLLWRRMSFTSSPILNALIIPLIALDLANICRGQSAYFIKYIYFHFIPGLIMIFACTGWHIRGMRVSRPAYA